MFKDVQKNQSDQRAEKKPNLVFLILFLGILSLASLSVMVFTVVKKMRQEVFAASVINNQANKFDYPGY